MIVQRQTLRDFAIFSGRGLHTGVPVTVKVHPGDQGIAFRLGSDRIPAEPNQVTDTTRCTRLGPVSTIEHLMSAFAALAITDAEVELDAPELPALDGASRVWFQGLQAAGSESLTPREIQLPFARTFHKEGAATVAIAQGDGKWKYIFDTGVRWPQHQEFTFDAATDDYESQIAPARTFAFEEELEFVRAAGLGQGLDETSALVLGAADYVNPPKFPDEPVRHKLLDLIGDLYLAGVPVSALNVVAERSGHTANVAAAAKLWHATMKS
jgi:UDP-3-O-acyl-N-acetylglucosamine deacetylase